MKAYYDRRAPEYDDWWLGTGLYARRARPGWAKEVAEIIGVVAALPPAVVKLPPTYTFAPDTATA